MVDRRVEHNGEHNSEHNVALTLVHATEDIEEPIVEYMVTTTDNPWNPFTDFNEWNAFDQASGYHTLSLLGRVVMTSDELSEEDQLSATEQAVDEIVQENILGIYRKVSSTPIAS